MVDKRKWYVAGVDGGGGRLWKGRVHARDRDDACSQAAAAWREQYGVPGDGFFVEACADRKKR